MRYFYCDYCDAYERVSNDVMRMIHAHPNAQRGQLYQPLYHELIAIAGPNHYGRATPALSDEEILGAVRVGPRKEIDAKLEKLEFLPGRDYIVLYDPISINTEYLANLPPRKGINVMFVPCAFRIDNDFVSETVNLENLEVIEEWVKERKARLKGTK